MDRLRAITGRIRYPHIVLAFFAASVIVCSVGSAALSVEYVAVFDTANRFIPQVILVTKDNVSESIRLITVYVNVPNDGSRSVLLYEYGIILFLNGEFVAQCDVLPNLALEPGSNQTLTVPFIVTDGYAQVILEAEQSENWSWDIMYPMRFYVSWLFVMAQGLGQAWSGIQEVP